MAQQIFVGLWIKDGRYTHSECGIAGSGRTEDKAKTETIAYAKEYLMGELEHVLSSESLGVISRELEMDIKDTGSYEYRLDDSNDTRYQFRIVDDFLG